MKNHPGIGVFLSILFFYPLNSQAQDCSIEKYWTLPITFNKHLPTVPIKINGHEVNIGVDTGAQTTIITPEMFNKLELEKVGHGTKVTGVHETNNVDYALLSTLEFAGVTYKQRAVPVVAIQEQTSRNQSPDPILGLLGVDFLSNYDVEMDMGNHTMTLYKVRGCHTINPPWQGDYKSFNGTYGKFSRMAIQVTLDGTLLNALFDTGASNLTLEHSSALRMGITDEMLANDRKASSVGVGGHAHQVPIHRFNSLVIGASTIENPNIEITDSPIPDADMLIGEDYMKGHRFWISYQTHTLFMQ